VSGGEVRGAMLLVALLACANAFAEELPAHDPQRVIHLAGLDEATDAMIAPDGLTAYVVAPRYELDLWALLVNHWMPLGGLLLLAALAWIALRIRHHWRRRTFAHGEPHCGACGYQLTGVTSAACPECGAAVHDHRVTGRSVRRPIVRLVRLAVLLIVGYVVSLVLVWGLQDAMRWRSATLMRWSTSAPELIEEYLWRYAGVSTELHAVSLDTSRIQRLAALPDVHAEQGWLASDGVRCFLRGSHGSLFVGPVHQLAAGDDYGSPWWVQSGPASVSHFFNSYDEQTIYAFDSNGRLRRVTPAGGYARAGSPGVTFEQFFPNVLSQSTQDMPWFFFADEHRLLGVHGNSLRFWRDDGSLISSITTDSGHDVAWGALARPQPHRLYIGTRPGSRAMSGPIELWNLEQGELIERITPRGGHTPMLFEVSPAGRYLYVMRDGPIAIDVRDETTGQWIATLNAPGCAWLWTLNLSADGSRLVALGADAQMNPRLLVYDTSAWRDPAPLP